MSSSEKRAETDAGGVRYRARILFASHEDPGTAGCGKAAKGRSRRYQGIQEATGSPQIGGYYRLLCR